jgi:hypothetical protein
LSIAHPSAVPAGFFFARPLGGVLPRATVAGSSQQLRSADVLAVHDGFTEQRYGRQGRFGRAGDHVAEPRERVGWDGTHLFSQSVNSERSAARAARSAWISGQVPVEG